MLTEILGETPLKLQQVEQARWLKTGLPLANGNKLQIVSFEAAVEEIARIKTTLCALRASNIPALLFLEKPVASVTQNQLGALLQFLREWDQLTLHNLLQLEEMFLPPEALSLFHTESRTETRWMREWLMASFDSRIAKYPGLPWRSFIRKIITENYEFAQNLFLLSAQSSTDPKPLHDLIRAFLIAKKKTVCVFPKHWGKVQ